MADQRLRIHAGAGIGYGLEPSTPATGPGLCRERQKAFRNSGPEPCDTDHSLHRTPQLGYAFGGPAAPFVKNPKMNGTGFVRRKDGAIDSGQHRVVRPAGTSFPIDSPMTRDGARRPELRVVSFTENQQRRSTPVNKAESRLRVLFLSPHYPPDVAATGQLVAELAEDLARAGHQPIVVASRPSYTDATRGSYKLLEREIRNGVEIHWLGVPGAGRRGIWSRLLPFAGYFAAAALRSIFFRRIDVVFAQSTPPLLAGLLASMHSLIPGRRFVYNLQDVYPELGQALGVLGDNYVTRLSKRVESRLRHRADVLTVLSPDMRSKVLASDPGLRNVEVIPNWIDVSLVAPVAAAENPFRHDNGLSDRFVVMYSGNLGRAHGVELLPDVAAALADLDDVVLLVIGAGPAKADIVAEVEGRGLKNVRFLPYQPKERLNESLSAADVALILQRRSAAGLVVPSKLYGVLASGRPAVAAVPPDSEVARVLREEEAGIVVEPESAQGIANAVRDLYGSRCRAAAMGKRARLAAVDRHDRQQATGRYIELLEQLSAS